MDQSHIPDMLQPSARPILTGSDRRQHLQTTRHRKLIRSTEMDHCFNSAAQNLFCFGSPRPPSVCRVQAVHVGSSICSTGCATDAALYSLAHSNFSISMVNSLSGHITLISSLGGAMFDSLLLKVKIKSRWNDCLRCCAAIWWPNATLQTSRSKARACGESWVTQYFPNHFIIIIKTWRVSLKSARIGTLRILRLQHKTFI